MFSRPKKITQGDVARRASVSQATVSHVLNSSTAISVPEETRQRVLQAINELGYVPDRFARSLRTRKTMTIASVIPDIANPFYPQFMRGIQDVVEQSGYDLITYNTDGAHEKEQKALRALMQGRVDGAIMVLFHLTARELRPLLENDVAVVRLESRSKSIGELPLDNIYVDSIAASRAAVRHLIAQGHTRIGMIAGQTGPRNDRMRGYEQALAEHNIALDSELIHSGDRFIETSGYTGMREFLTLPHRPTAVFAANDLIAMGALLALYEARLRVPQEMAVIGFDDIPAAKLMNPPLTTVSQFQEKLGRRAAEMLLERLTGRMSGPGRDVEMPFTLMTRESA